MIGLVFSQRGAAEKKNNRQFALDKHGRHIRNPMSFASAGKKSKATRCSQ